MLTLPKIRARSRLDKLRWCWPAKPLSRRSTPHNIFLVPSGASPPLGHVGEAQAVKQSPSMAADRGFESCPLLRAAVKINRSHETRSIAQLAERRSPKPQVGGSIPPWPAGPVAPTSGCRCRLSPFPREGLFSQQALPLSFFAIISGI